MSALETYAVDVLDGKIKACHRIKQMYEKLLYRYYNPGQWHFDQQIADKHIGFMERFCKQPESGKPLRFELFQRAKMEAIFGFVDDCGLRQFQEVLTVEGRKNGKTTEMAAVELDLLMNDGEGSPQVYNVATKRDQACLGFNAALAMVKRSASLYPLVRKRVGDLYCPGNMGFIKPLASNSNSLDGLNSHGVIIDELAAIKNRDLYDLMKQSMSARTQPLLFAITTNGFIRENIFDAQYEYACGVLDGTIDDERFAAFIYELDDPDEWTDETCWIKANPGLGAIKSYTFLKGCVEKAKSDPAFLPTVKVKDFNLKETGSTAWLRWDEVENEATFTTPFDYCVGGFDAADTTDLNAAKALMMRPDDPNLYVKSMYWLPETVLEQSAKTGSRRERDNMPYELWVKQGYMRVWEGNKVDKACFLQWFMELRDKEDLYTMFIGYDPWHIDDSLLAAFKAEFGPQSMIPVRQGIYTLSEPMKQIKADLQAKRIIYNNNPVDKMCLANTEIKADINGNIQPVKGLDSRKRIDGTIALICGYKVLKDKYDQFVNLNG